MKLTKLALLVIITTLAMLGTAYAEDVYKDCEDCIFTKEDTSKADKGIWILNKQTGELKLCWYIIPKDDQTERYIKCAVTPSNNN